MSSERDVITVALEAGQHVFMHAQGDPARTLAYGVAAAVAMTGTAIGYGTYKYGHKVIDWLAD
ncbi:hypothetical protein [Trichloromonas sp.]|uniref:hypothetical protein n=1 Tax=Trichloromonas sp. TaxID=3069249 RepID=UPI002A41FF8C|nr:hypothetical protein [Trichloromonas sp.]